MVVKGFDFKSTFTNRKVEIQSDVLSCLHNSRQLLGKLICLGLTLGKNIEFSGISKGSTKQDFTEITLIVEETKQYLIQRPSF